MNILFVALGGAIGAWFRFVLGNKLSQLKISSSFPFPILFINWLGSFLAGISPLTFGYQSLFAIIGIIGGFTTFSTFSVETMLLIQQKRIFYAVLYVVLTIVGSILFLGLGILILKKII